MTALQAPRDVVTRLWRDAALDPSALERLTLSGQEPALPSSFAVGTAAQASLAVAALAASEIGRARNGLAQGVTVPMQDAAMECLSWFSIDGRTPPAWDKLSGLYRCADGWVRVHANFAHHRDGVLRLLGLAEGPDAAQRGRGGAGHAQRAGVRAGRGRRKSGGRGGAHPGGEQRRALVEVFEGDGAQDVHVSPR